MEATSLDFLLVTVGVSALILVGFIVIIGVSYKKVPQGKALVRTGVGGKYVIFDGGFVFPLLHQHEYMDIIVHKMLLKFEGSDGLLLEDNQIIDAKVAVFVRTNPESVKEVAMTMGCENASDKDYIENMFKGKFLHGIRASARMFSSANIYDNREELNRMIRMTVGTQFNGFILEDLSIDYLQQLPQISKA